jgi:DNA-binding NarL/FixJ family response regulator
MLLDVVRERGGAEEDDILQRLRSNVLTVHSLVTNYLDHSKIEVRHLTLVSEKLPEIGISRVGQQDGAQARHHGVKVVIADDHTLFRQGLSQLLRSAEDITVVGEARDGHEALRLVLETKPDVITLNISMPGLGGLEAAKEIFKQDLPPQVIFLTMHNDPAVAHRAIKSGTSGYVLKDNAFEDLLYALRAVASGGTFISPSLAREVLKTKEVGEEEDGVLTGREREVLRWIASGLTNRQIAKELFLSVKTVETHRARMMQKLDLHTTAALVRYALERGLIRS